MGCRPRHLLQVYVIDEALQRIEPTVNSTWQRISLHAEAGLRRGPAVQLTFDFLFHAKLHERVEVLHFSGLLRHFLFKLIDLLS